LRWPADNPVSGSDPTGDTPKPLDIPWQDHEVITNKSCAGFCYDFDQAYSANMSDEVSSVKLLVKQWKRLITAAEHIKKGWIGKGPGRRKGLYFKGEHANTPLLKLRKCDREKPGCLPEGNHIWNWVDDVDAINPDGVPYPTDPNG
jgi:hypothetical protein